MTMSSPGDAICSAWSSEHGLPTAQAEFGLAGTGATARAIARAGSAQRTSRPVSRTRRMTPSVLHGGRRVSLGSVSGDRARERLDEVLELLGRPALVRLAVLFVRRDHRVAVVPVQARLGVQPERPAGLAGDVGEEVGAGVAAVGAR